METVERGLIVCRRAVILIMFRRLGGLGDGIALFESSFHRWDTLLPEIQKRYIFSQLKIGYRGKEPNKIL